MKRSGPIQRRAPLRAKAPPPRPAKLIAYTPRPRATVRPIRPQQPPAAPVPKAAPVRDEAYRRLVAALPCIHCGIAGRSQAAHGPSLGRGIKACDTDTFPLCADGPGRPGCHARFDRYELFDAEHRREMAALWADQTRALLGRA